MANKLLESILERQGASTIIINDTKKDDELNKLIIELIKRMDMGNKHLDDIPKVSPWGG